VTAPKTHTAEETAAIIGGDMTASWLKEKARRREIPFTMLANRYSWTTAQIAEIIAGAEYRPQPQARRAASPSRRNLAAGAEAAPAGVVTLTAKTPAWLRKVPVAS
jgi:hypothetical protein